MPRRALLGAGGRAQPNRFVYGPGLQSDDLANIQVGGTFNYSVDYFFIPETTAALNSVKVYIINEDFPGYGAGTGGTLRVSVQGDNGSGYPNGTTLASQSITGPFSALGTDFPTWTFSSPATLTAGTKYHLVWENTDASPTVNYVSLDLMWNNVAQTPRQIRWTDKQLGINRKYLGDWAFNPSEQQKYTPIMQLTYAGGLQQGFGYMEAGIVGPTAPGTITGTNSMVRERFTVTGGSRLVTGAGVRVQRISGTDGLLVRLENTAGTLIDSFTIPAASIPTGANDGTGYPAVMASGQFATPRALSNATEYRLRLSCAGTSQYKAWVIRKGSDYGFVAATYFNDGFAEKTTNGSTWTSLGFAANVNDLQCYFW
jgi:hypothetical protein